MTEAGAIFLCLAACACFYVITQRIAMRLAAGDRDKEYAPPPLAGDLAAAVVGVAMASFFFVLTGRPGMSALLSSALIALLLVLNRAKENILREPLVLADAWLLPQVWKYPEMYFPFLPVKQIVAALAVVILCLAVLLWMEERIPYTGNAGLYCLLAWLAALPPLVLWTLRRASLPPGVEQLLPAFIPVSHDPARDAATHGPLAAALMHPVQAGRLVRNKPDFMRDAANRPAASRWPEPFEDMLRAIQATTLDARPHVLLIQAESFCDVREHLKEGQKEALGDFLPNWDRLKAGGRTLPTPQNAYGAYTMRTEFSTLTGLAMKELGPFAFNPYLLAAQQPVWSLGHFFRAQGYQTVCIHPYHKGFFRRDKVMPNLGFDRFLGIEELDALERFGPYVSDIALGKAIMQGLEACARPCFYFAITMEAHGPWREGRIPLDEETPAGFGIGASQPLEIYLRHLRNLDTMLGMFLQSKIYLDGRFHCWIYGDHLPSGIF